MSHRDSFLTPKYKELVSNCEVSMVSVVRNPNRLPTVETMQVQILPLLQFFVLSMRNIVFRSFFQF